MKKLICALAAVAALAATAAEEPTYQMLYWQVTADSLVGEGFDYSDASYAKLYATLGEGGQVFTDMRIIDKSVTSEDLDYLDAWKSGYNVTPDWTSSLSGANFYVELLNESRGFMAKSESIGYADLLAGGYLDVNQTGMGAPVNATDAYVFRGYTAIPEPTSGVLLLVGAAVMALRRRNARA